MKPRRTQSGLAAVEFVICMPILLLVMLAVVELVRAYTQYSTLAHSVRDAARYVAGQALLGTSGVLTVSATLQTQARNLVIYGNVAGTGTPRLPGLAPGQITAQAASTVNVQVSATYAYQPLLGNTIRGFGYGPDRSSRFTFSIVSTLPAL